MERLDNYEDLPRSMREYLKHNGWHFSKNLAEWAIGKMKDTDGKKMKMVDRATVENILAQQNMTPEHGEGYDCVFVWNMLKSDYGDLLAPDDKLAKAVKRYIDDPDGYEGIALTRFYADCIAKGIPVLWEDMR